MFYFHASDGSAKRDGYLWGRSLFVTQARREKEQLQAQSFEYVSPYPLDPQLTMRFLFGLDRVEEKILEFPREYKLS